MPGDQMITPIEVITRHCRYSGLLETRGRRVSDVLSDAGTDLVELRDTVIGVAGVASADVHCEHIVLRKSEILMVIPKGKYEAPIRRHAMYVEKPRYGVMVVLPGHVLSGIMHLSARANPLVLLDEDNSLPRFVALTDATVHASSHDLGESHFDVLILRRASIESVQLMARPLPKPQYPGRTAEREVLPRS
jgi:hypothetical protein